MTDHDDSPVTVGWVEKQLKNLKQDAEEIWEVQPSVASEFHPWSALKLIVLSAVVDIYSKIIPHNFDNMFYVDLLAGSGSVTVNSEAPEREKERLVGSPVLAAAMAHEPFEHMYLVEEDEDRANALRDRLRYVAENLDYNLDRDKFTVIQDDANDYVDDLVDELQDIAYESKSAHSLVFVDNEGATISWESIKRLTAVYTDFLINFPGNDAQRMVGAEKESALTRFYGDKRWKVAGTNPNYLRLIYQGNLAAVGKPAQHAVRVQGSKSYYYDLIYAAYETKGSNPYITALERFGDRVDRLRGEDIDKVLSYMRGEATDFTPFPGPDPDQSGLSDFS